MKLTDKSVSAGSPLKSKQTFEITSPEKTEKGKQKLTIPSFLDGFTCLTEDDLEILADYEEEQRRLGHFEMLFPTKETIESLGPFFDC